MATDLPAAIVAWAARVLPPDRAEWGQAMTAEMQQYHGRARWRFAVGCAVAAVGLPKRDRGGRWIPVAVLVAAVVSAGLVGYGFVRYPGMIKGGGTWLALTAFALTLTGFVVAVRAVSRRTRVGPFDLSCGGVLAAIWIAVGALALSGRGKEWMLALFVLPVVTIAAGALAARHGRTRTAGLRTVVVAAVVAALAVFLVLAADTLITGGRPYDAGQLRDFAGSGYPDIATYAVSDDLGTDMVLLLLMFMMTAVLGSAGTLLGVRRSREGLDSADSGAGRPPL